MNSIQILAGVVLILFGIRFLRKGMDRLFGGRLLVWLARLTENRWRAFGAGMGTGALAPSSTSISLLAVQLLADPRLHLTGVLAMVLGANLGMTVMIQIIAFPVQDLVSVAILVGGIGFLRARSDYWRGIGQCLLALGFIFLAIQWIGAGASAMTESREASEVFRLLGGHPWLVFVGTLLLVLAMQSSTATIGLGLGLSGAGLLGGGALLPWILGTNVGVGVGTFLLGSGTLRGRKLGAASVLAKLVVAIPLRLLPMWGPEIFQGFPGDTAQRMAMAHSAFNLVVGVVSLPLLGWYLKGVTTLLPREAPDFARVHSFLDDGALETPSLALARATRETLRMSDKVRGQLEGFWQAFRTDDVVLAAEVQGRDDDVDQLNREIIDYLSRIEGEMNPRDNRRRFALIGFAVELEAVGDLLEKQLCGLVSKQRAEGAVLARADSQSLEAVYASLLQRFDQAMSLLSVNDLQAAENFVEEKRGFNEDCRQLQATHYNRFQGGDRAAHAANSYFLDYLNGLRRIHSHITSVAYVLVESWEGQVRTRGG